MFVLAGFQSKRQRGQNILIFAKISVESYFVEFLMNFKMSFDFDMNLRLPY